MKRGVIGRANTFKILRNQIQSHDKTIWLHCASLGEYEQGLPVFEILRKDYPNHKIILSFFSPSGYEIKKDSSIADVVVYLPLDTRKNAQTFIKLAHPELVLFVKYEIWPYYLYVLKSKRIKTLLISALFRENQIYFKWYGLLMRHALFAFEHVFVQDIGSKELLQSINYDDVTISGDTRFDRVYNQLQSNIDLLVIKTFINGELCIVCGSTWPEDDALLIDFINNTPFQVKFIIAPHNIKSRQITQLQNQIIKNTILYSESNQVDISKYVVLIIDSIGLLSRTYKYANIAYVGGAVGNTGLHNILEPAVFGIPIITGTNHSKFPEAKQLTLRGGLFSIKSKHDLASTLNQLIENESLIKMTGSKNLEYVEENRGAVIQIIDYIRK